MSRPADPRDVASPESIVAALYDVISGDAGVGRDWDRFRSLFHPEGRLIPVGPDPQAPEGPAAARVLTPDGYIGRAGALLEGHGFHEREVARREDRHGAIAQVWSTYESRLKADDPSPFAGGINSIQLFHDGRRWWVLSVAWTAQIPPEKASLTKA